eukprot:scpid13785/ scgid0778/ 
MHHQGRPQTRSRFHLQVRYLMAPPSPLPENKPVGCGDCEALVVGCGDCEELRDLVEKLQREVDELREENVLLKSRECLDELLATEHGRVKVVNEICKIENKFLFAETLDAISHSKESRKVESLLGIPAGRITSRSYNPVVEAFVCGMTAPLSVQSSAGAAKRSMRQQEAIESVYAARNLNYCSQFHMVFQAVVYAITQSKTAVDMIGHLGPGSSYALLKDWLGNLGGEPVKVPRGFVTVGFDNEQRQMRSYLSRGANRSTYEILTNVVYALHSAQDLQSVENYHMRHWSFPSEEQLLEALRGPAPTSPASPMHSYLASYVGNRIAGLAMEHNNGCDPVVRFRQEEEASRSFIVCPGCQKQYEKRKVKCSNSECAVTNIRAAIAEAAVFLECPGLKFSVFRLPRQWVQDRTCSRQWLG